METPEYSKHPETDEIQTLIKEAWEQSWWRKFVQLVKERRAFFLESLVGGTLDQREEDRIRGQASEDAFIIGLDEIAARANREEKKDAKGTETARLFGDGQGSRGSF